MKRSPLTASVPVLLVRSSRAALVTLGAVALANVVLGACQTPPDRDLGDSIGDRALDLHPQAPLEPFGVSVSEFAGRWVGTAEEPLALGGERDAYAFPSGSEQFVLDIAPDEQGQGLTGTIVFGSGSPPPPPVDPEIGYPTDVDYSQLGYFNRGALAAILYFGPLPPYEGYPYPVYSMLGDAAPDPDGSGNFLIADGVLNLGFDTMSLLAPWCELQEPQPTSWGFDCIGDRGGLSDDEGHCFLTGPDEEGATTFPEPTPIDCDKLFLCGSFRCSCVETNCFYSSDAASTGQLLLRRDGDALVGVFSNAAFSNERQLPVPLGTVRFTRVAD